MCKRIPIYSQMLIVLLYYVIGLSELVNYSLLIDCYQQFVFISVIFLGIECFLNRFSLKLYFFFTQAYKYYC